MKKTISSKNLEIFAKNLKYLADQLIIEKTNSKNRQQKATKICIKKVNQLLLILILGGQQP